MRPLILLLGGVCWLFLTYLPAHAQTPTIPNGPANDTDRNSLFDRQLNGLKRVSPDKDAPAKDSAADGKNNASPNTVNGRNSERSSPSAAKSLIERGYAQAREAAARQLQQGLLWAGEILAVVGLLSGVSLLVWKHRSRRKPSRANPMVHLLMFPTAYPVPPEPPVSGAIPQPGAAHRPKMRSAA